MVTWLEAHMRCARLATWCSSRGYERQPMTLIHDKQAEIRGWNFTAFVTTYYEVTMLGSSGHLPLLWFPDFLSVFRP
jgi:hypothetical protein